MDCRGRRTSGAVVGQEGALGREFSRKWTARDTKPTWGEGYRGEDVCLKENTGESGVGGEGREASGHLSCSLGGPSGTEESSGGLFSQPWERKTPWSQRRESLAAENLRSEFSKQRSHR